MGNTLDTIQLGPKIQDRLWDVAIIGAGMGGGFLARALADAGHDVLLMERGNEKLPAPGSDTASEDPEKRLAESRWPNSNTFEIDGVASRQYAPIGSGVGGSANWYAAALERFGDIDLDSQSDSAHPTGGWPIRYSELLPYYEQAERMLHVVGTNDPLSAHEANHLGEPPPLGPADSEFVRFFQESGMHPYRLHVGIRYLPGCDECLGRLCYRDCRADVRSVLAEARKKPTILSRCEVKKLESTGNRVTCALGIQGEKQIKIRAKVFVLAAGAIHTPKLLLQSRNDQWPDGLANRSGLVGCNLMFHVNQSFVLWPSRKTPNSGPRKSIGFRDFYVANGRRCGFVQSTGFELRYGELLMHLYRRFDHGAARRLRLFRPFLRIPAAFTIKRLGSGTIFACLIEDFPYRDNRVILDDREDDGVRIQYTIRAELCERTAHFRKLLTDSLKGRRMTFLSDDIELNYGHPCGTCVMSDDPSKGVVDRNCRVHGIDNFFIVDASFMPSSAACNPSLTIAANALRVSAVIHRGLMASDSVAEPATV
jgi:choline dehydrogenase-like flavoprotein